MLRRHSLMTILGVPALALAACSPSKSDNITATDNGDVATLSGDTAGNDDLGPADNSALLNDLLAENETAPNASAAQ